MKAALRLYTLAAVLCLILLPFSCIPAKAAEPEIKSCVAIKAMEPALPEGVQRAWGKTNKFWARNYRVRVKFLGGTSKQQSAAWKRFNAIDALVNLSFSHVKTEASEIRVSFQPGNGHWSYVGTDSRAVPQNSTTMNIDLDAGLFGDSDDEWNRVVLHEILHSLGIEHEHQSPLVSGFVWNKPAVYEYYGRTQGWSNSQIDFQILNRYTGTGYNGTRFDVASIMCYPIPPGLANITIGWNKQLSSSDVAFLRQIYP